jgi:hypothetical protein
MDPDMDLKRRQSINNTVVFSNIVEKNPHHRNLIDRIIFLYRREILDEIHDIENLRLKLRGELPFSIYINLFSSILI